MSQRVRLLASSLSSIALLIGLFSLPLLNGCGGGSSSSSQSSTTAGRTSTTAAQGRVDHLQLAMDFVFSPERFRSEAYIISVAGSLNRWAERLEDIPEWQQDELFSTLDDDLLKGLPALELDALSYDQRDAEFLQEAFWCYSLAQWLAKEDRYVDFRYLFDRTREGLSEQQLDQFNRSDDRLAMLVALEHEELDAEQAKQLATLLRVFDWLSRNVQLTEQLPEPTELEISQLALVSSSSESPATKGVPGPGYTLFPWQSLKFGRGDAWQRGRIFMMVCRQLDIDAVMLAVPENQPGDESNRLIPWLPAVRFGEELYLFDSQLGLPLRDSSDDKGILKLSDLQEDPSRLNSFDLDEVDGVDEPQPYRVSPDQIANVTALIDAATPWLSRKMKVLESNLTGKQRLILTLDASAQAERIKACQGITDARLWRIPYDTLIYRNIYERLVSQQNSRIMQSYLMQEGVYDRDIQFLTGRHRAILGILENSEDDRIKGAKTLFSEHLFPDEFFEELQASRDLQVMYGIDVKGEMTAEAKVQLLQILELQLRLIRANSSYWLALAHGESTKPATALNWFKRVSKYDKDDRWLSGTRYNTARVHETVGQFNDAIEAYRQTDSPQQAGDRLRARWLESLPVISGK